MENLKNKTILFTFLLSFFLSCENKNSLVLEKNEKYSMNETTCYNLITPSGKLFLVYIDSLGNLDKIRNDSSGNYQGVFFNHNMQIQTIFKCSNNKTEGRVYYFYENSGFLSADFNYKNGVKTGNAVLYYDTSAMLKETMLYNDFGELYFREKYDRNGKIIGREGSDGSFNQ
jgi:antitoxin component YwqK of YwqJK toxin-antitoxin module